MPGRWWEEFVPFGYKGSYQRVRAHLREKRLPPGPVSARPPTPRTVSRWILRHPDTLTESEQLRLKAVLVHCPELDALTRARPVLRPDAHRARGRTSTAMARRRPAGRSAPIHTLAAGIDRDRDAVTAGLIAF